MKTQAISAAYRSPLIWGITAIVLFAFGTAAVNAWTQTTTATAGADISLAADEPASPVASVGSPPNSRQSADGRGRLRTTCDECGVVTSTRVLGQSAVDGASSARRLTRDERSGIAGKSVRSEITVRMKNGSSYVFVEAGAATWRSGEQMLVLASAGEPTN
jgi:hypothetical protein